MEAFEGSRGIGRVVVAVFVFGWMTVGCGGPQKIHHYKPEAIAETVEARSTRTAPDLVLAVEDFGSSAAYDEQRMVYRSADYRLDYYHFHRWSAPPGMIVAETLRSVYRKTGAFKAVVSGYAARADVVLTGNVLSFEELDASKKKWLGHVELDLRLRDAVTGELLWTSTVRKRKTLPKQSPKGLARAISAGLTEIGVESVDQVVRHAKKAVRQRRREENQKTNPSSGTSSSPSTNTSGPSDQQGPSLSPEK